MTITVRQLLFVLGGALMAVGLVLGFAPVSADGGSCGGVFTGDQAVYREGLYRSMTGKDPFAFQAECTDARASRTTLTWALLAPGILLAGAGLLVSPGPKPDPAANAPGSGAGSTASASSDRDSKPDS